MTGTLNLIDHPFPQLRRDRWRDLNGPWQFATDDGDEGLSAGWQSGFPSHMEIIVPFVHQSEASGIADKAFHPIVWYSRTFMLSSKPNNTENILLHFEGVDYHCTVWINGSYAGEHTGGNSRFAIDVTPFAISGENLIVLRVTDDLTDMTILRGKQYWKERAEVMWFTPMTGIWRDVWLEIKPCLAIDELRMTPHIDSEEIELELTLTSRAKTISGIRLQATISFEGQVVTTADVAVHDGRLRLRIGINDFNDHGLGRWWSPEHPNLYDLDLTLTLNGKICDVVHSYFGMREVAIVNGKFCLNHRPYFLRMVLDQGYFKESILTPPSFEALERDVHMAKELGFNTVRKHMMGCQARYAYLCDVYGLLVWSEMAGAYDYSTDYALSMISEWSATVQAGYNHPSIVTWVPLNESWGVPNIYYSKQQQAHANSLYYLTKSLDSTRPVISNDGWEHCISDLFTIHDYSSDIDVLQHRYSSVDHIIEDMPGLEGRKFLFCPGYHYNGQPVMCTEMGGVNYRLNHLGAPVEPRCSSKTEFLERVRTLMEAYYNSPLIQGVCYTQLTDTETEICGLLTWNREPKAPIEELRSIFMAKR
ncbi:sugar-binding domain-containing protein [Bifidobacterium sp. SO4]|uniref:glycoside hydrolase family 2 protein n=1 Tax=Bifidobacterium sp. SO4 TaxID=2809030 RepID=UPI001BDD5A48|nr:sugar-binding domain-containing protein [Bifidobacterium sp. SO4]MBT1170633.1 hypothetical protein [Bifidobacterium sp. SO4]